jgi:hypothetical protein
MRNQRITHEKVEQDTRAEPHQQHWQANFSIISQVRFFLLAGLFSLHMKHERKGEGDCQKRRQLLNFCLKLQAPSTFLFTG